MSTMYGILATIGWILAVLCWVPLIVVMVYRYRQRCGGRRRGFAMEPLPSDAHDKQP
jgi:hypothetical protein